METTKIATTKKVVLYFSDEKKVIGTRNHAFNWKAGDTIMTNGVKTEIYVVIPCTRHNIILINGMFKMLNSTTSRTRYERDEVMEDFLSGFPQELRGMARGMLMRKIVERRPKFSYGQKFDIVDAFLDNMEGVED